MTVTASLQHGTVTADTISLHGLATSSTLATGREGTAVDHTVGKEIDSLVGGKVTVGTTPTANTQIQIWAFGSYDGTSYSGGATGIDAALTPQSTELLRLVTVIPNVGTTSNQQYNWGPFSLAQIFGGTLPRKTGIFVTHNTGVNLNATPANHEVKRTPVSYASA